MSDEQIQQQAGLPAVASAEAGPPSPSFLTLVLKTFAGLGGGIAGMVILLVIFLGAATILGSAFNPNYWKEKRENIRFLSSYSWR